MKPTISIIIPTYNRAELLKETLDSVLQQAYEQWECIIVDDGSSDNTRQVVENYNKKDTRFKYYERPSNLIKGANACRNYGFKQSKGSLIKWFDSDDIMKPEFLLKQVNYLIKHPELDCCVAYGETFKDSLDATVINKPKSLSNKNALYHFLKDDLYFITHGPLWRRTFLDKQDLYDETLAKFQDGDFHLRMILKQMNFYFLDESLFYIRTGNTDRISTTTTISLLNSMFIFEFSKYKCITNLKAEHQKEIHYFLTKKISLILYRILIFESTIVSRYELWKEYKSQIYSLFRSKFSSNLFKAKLLLAIYVTILTRKGLVLFKTVFIEKA